MELIFTCMSGVNSCTYPGIRTIADASVVGRSRHELGGLVSTTASRTAVELGNTTVPGCEDAIVLERDGDLCRELLVGGTPP